MKPFWEQPLRRQLFLFILLLLVPLFVGVAWSGFTTYGERLADLNDQTRVTAITFAETLSREVTALDRLTRNLEVRFLSATEPGEPLRMVQRLLERPGVISLAARRKSGEEIVHTGTGLDELSDGAWSASVFASGASVVSPAVFPVGPGGRREARVVLAYPLRNSTGEVTAAMGFLMRIQDLQEAFSIAPLPPGSVMSINDADGRVLARSSEAEKYLGKVAYDQRPPEPVSLVREGVDGVRRVYSSAPIKGTPWRLNAGIPVQVAFAKAMTLWRRNIIVLILGVSGWLFVAFVMSRRLGGSVAHLQAAARRFASGDFSPLEHKQMATLEFAELQKAFDQMVRSFNTTRKGLDAQMHEEREMREELQSLQRQVIRQERLAAVGQLVSGVAHEINNPLQAILGFAELLQMQSDLPEDVKSDLRLIQKESARACGIIRNLALFARQQQGEPSAILLGDVITSVAELRQRRLESENIELRIENTATQRVMATLPELQQVLLNFVVNAEQSIIMSGRLPGRITARARDEDGMVVLEVEDTGPGVPADQEAKLFQPFHTTKPVGQGTGLGLSVSYGIIDSLDGRIGFRKAPSGGAIFYFELPVAPADA